MSRLRRVTSACLWVTLAGATTACLDWDSLRRRADGGADAGTDVAGVDEGAAVVEWAFARYAMGVVPDLGLPPPDVPLVPDADEELALPTVMGEELAMQGARLLGSPQATAEMGQRLLASGGAFSFEIWFRHGGVVADDERPALVRVGADSGFSLELSPASLSVFIHSTSVGIDTAQPFEADGALHHVAITYRPGAASLLTIYIDGNAVGVSGDEAPRPETTLSWPDQDASFAVGDAGLVDLHLRSAALFARELTAGEIAGRFARGPRR